MDGKIKDLKADFKKLKDQFETSQKALMRETHLRIAAENEAQKNNKKINVIKKQEEKKEPPVVKIVYQDQTPKGPTQISVFVKTMEKLFECKPSLKLSNLTQEIIDDAKMSVGNYRIYVAFRFANLCQKYIEYRRHLDMQQRVRATIVAKKSEGTPSEKIREKWRGALNRFQTIYWHLETQQERIKCRESNTEVDNSVAKYRQDVGQIFHKIAEILLKRKQEIKDTRVPPEQTETRDWRQKTTRQLSDSTTSEKSGKHLIAPSNSVLSDQTSTTQPVRKLSFHVPTDDSSYTTEQSHDREIIKKHSSAEDDQEQQEIEHQRSDVEVVQQVISELLENGGEIDDEKSAETQDEQVEEELDRDLPAVNQFTEEGQIEEREVRFEDEREDSMIQDEKNDSGKSDERILNQNRPSKEDIITKISTPTRVFSRTNSLAPEVSDEYKKNRDLISALSRMTSSTRRHSLTAPVPGSPAQTWDRRLSIAVQPHLPLRKSSAWMESTKDMISIDLSRKDSLMQIAPEVPKTLQLDVHDVLHKARKHLQNSIRRQSLAERRPSTSLSDLGSFMRARRSTITGGILPGVLERNDVENKNIDENEMLKQYRLPFDLLRGNETIKKTTSKSNNVFEIQAVQPPANHYLPKSRPATKSTMRRGSIRRKITAETHKHRSSELERKPSSRERFENEMKAKSFKKLEKSLSEEMSNKTTPLSVKITRRKSASDVITLPSISSSSINNK